MYVHRQGVANAQMCYSGGDSTYFFNGFQLDTGVTSLRRKPVKPPDTIMTTPNVSHTGQPIQLAHVKFVYTKRNRLLKTETPFALFYYIEVHETWRDKYTQMKLISLNLIHVSQTQMLCT